MSRDYEKREGVTTGDSAEYHHFEETLSSDDAPGGGYISWILVALGIFTVVPVLAVGAGIFLFAPFDVSEFVSELPPMVFIFPAIFVFGIVGFLFVMFGTAYFHNKAKLHVRVTDTGVEVEQEMNPLASHSGTEIPFDEIRSVEYSETDGTHIHVKQGEGDAETYMVQNPWRRRKGGTFAYPGGIRIEREGGSPVYIGSKSPMKLAETIVRRAEGVGEAEKLSLDSATLSLDDIGL